MKSRPLAPLGAPARVTVTKVVRTSWRIEWEYDGNSSFWEEASHSMEAEPVRRRRVRHMQGRGVAYRAAAMRYIFVRRDRYAVEVIDGKRRVTTANARWARAAEHRDILAAMLKDADRPLCESAMPTRRPSTPSS